MTDFQMILFCIIALVVVLVLFYITESIEHKKDQQEKMRIKQESIEAHKKIDEEYNEKIRKIEEREKEDLARIDSVLNEARELVEKMKNEMENKK